MTESICKIDEFGDKYWYLNGEFHREDGPAVEYTTGTKIWYLNGHIHRQDGPAIEYYTGTKEWWLNGKLISQGERPQNWDELVLLAQVEKLMND